MSKIDIDFEVCWPPSLNNYYERTRRGVFMKARGRSYRLSIADELQQQVGVLDTIVDKICVCAILYPPSKRVWDLDNHMKALLDALTHNNFWADDKLVTQLLLYKGQVVQDGLVKLHVIDAMPVVGPDWSPKDLVS